MIYGPYAVGKFGFVFFDSLNIDIGDNFQYKLGTVLCSPKMMHFWTRQTHIQYVIVTAKSFAEFLLCCSYNSTTDRRKSL